MTELDADLQMQPIQAASVVSLAYERIRTLILNGEVPAGTRLGQVELAERLGISRTPVREALRRLTGEGLVEFQDNRGFRVAQLRLEDVLQRLEVRLLLEPGAARLAAERATEADLAELEASVEREVAARTAVAVHDASREFHIGVARASHNRELVMALENLWLIEVGRRLLAQRRAAPHWQDGDVAEHRAILAAIAARDGDRAAALMESHVRDALQHWEPERERAQ
ncbi:MAG TPA: GntR family transcriptional regulator [Capillimicrobium sp.]|nr:GntR family transcriptional regulator [Capillimicrobium sp.]